MDGIELDNYHVDFNVLENPPAYSSSNGASKAQLERNLHWPVVSLLDIDFHEYELPLSTVSEDQHTTTTTCPLLTSKPDALIELLRVQAALPPRPLIRIRGTHSEYGSSYGPLRSDFDLKLDLLPLITPAGTNKRKNVRMISMGDSRSDGESQASKQQEVGLEEWAKRFCDDPSESKSFTLERRVTNWDTEYLEGQVRSVVASTKYQGNVEVSFLMTFSRVEVVKRGKESLKPRACWNWKGIRSSENETVQRYDVVQFVWPYADSPSGVHQYGPRKCTVQTEQDWWYAWKGPIRNAILGKRHGWVALEDWTDVAMGIKAAEREKPWGAHGDWRNS